MTIRQAVEQFDIFRGLTAPQLEAVLDDAERVAIGRGNVVFEESIRDIDLYILLEGRVSIELGSPRQGDIQEPRLELALFRPGEVFGEIAFLRGTRRSARVIAIDDIEVLRLDGGRLARKCEQDHALGYRIMGNLARILAGRMETINLKHRDDIRS